MSLFSTWLAPPVLGIDWSGEAVYAVSVQGSAAHPQVVWAEAYPLQAGAAPLPLENRSEAVMTDTLRALLRHRRIRIRQAATAMPSSAVIVKIVEIPQSVQGDAVEEHIRFSGTEFISQNIDSVQFDYMDLGPAQRPKYQRLLLAVCRKEEADKRLAILESCGLKVPLIDIRQFALWSIAERAEQQAVSSAAPVDIPAHQNSGAEPVSMLIEIGYHTTSLYAFHGNSPYFAREHRFGFIMLIAALQRQYNLTENDAWNLYRHGGLPPDYPQKVLTPVLQSLSTEIVHALEYFQASLPDLVIRQVHCFGFFIGSPGWLDLLGQRLHVPVDAPDPFAHMGLPARYQALSLEERSRMAVACGLALRRFSNDYA